MSKTYQLVEYLSNINTVIKQPLMQMHRIKFTCLDVSQNFIAFGATSGGVYVFNRCPCKFIKLVPNKEGGVTNVSISPDENYVAISTVKGLIVIIENCFLDSNMQYQVYAEHLGHHVTTMKWQNSEVYIGDDEGTISVISLSGRLSKSFFQSLSATLMHLDSSIVQLDTCSKYLLASTKTKTVLCDTEMERFRQIGKKLRDGKFGACFFIDNQTDSVSEVVRKQERSLFKGVKDSDHVGFEEVKGVKIYCARPGARIWEAKFDATVLYTHQFKSLLSLKSSSIIHINSSKTSTLNISAFDLSLKGFNFEKVLMLKQFIITFCEDSIYMFDVHSMQLIWTNYFTNIRDIKVLDNVLYIWCGKFYLKMLHLMELENIIENALYRKQYLLCTQLCLHYQSIILTAANKWDYNRLKILKAKMKDANLLKDLSQFLECLEEQGLVNIRESKNGIYVVNKGPSDELKFDKESDLTKVDELEKTDEVELKILYNQYQINKFNCTVDTPQLLELIQKKHIINFIDLFNTYINYITTTLVDEENTAKLWFYCLVLRHSSDLNIEIDYRLQLFLCDAFINVNKTNHNCRSCFYPLPSAKNQLCQYYQLGSVLLNKLSDFKCICNHVPQMYKWLLEKSENCNVTLLVQYNDKELFSKHSKTFTYDTWDECCKLLIKLGRNICLNCESAINFNGDLDLNWNCFAVFMLKSLGGPSTLKLLRRYSKHIEPGEIKHDFYQFCIINSVLENRSTVHKEVARKILDSIDRNHNQRNHLEAIVGTYLCKRSVGEELVCISQNRSCSICDIPEMPPRDKFLALRCGHFCHKICLSDFNQYKICNLVTDTSILY